MHHTQAIMARPQCHSMTAGEQHVANLRRLLTNLAEHAMLSTVSQCAATGSRRLAAKHDANHQSKPQKRVWGPNTVPELLTPAVHQPGG